MKLKKKVSDFIRLEEGNIGRQSAVVTGALLASGVLGAILVSPVKASYHYDHANWWDTCHNNDYAHHVNYFVHCQGMHSNICNHGNYYEHSQWCSGHHDHLIP